MRILFITSSRIGDAVLSTGLLDWLARTYPRARITVACGAAAAGLFEAAPNVTRVIPMTKRKRAGHWFDLWRATCGHLWHLVVDLRGSALGWAIPALRRRVLKSSWEPKHRIVHLASALGIDPQLPVLWTSPDRQAEALRLIPPGGPVLALGPTANWAPKQWPAERFAELAERLTAPGGLLPDSRVAVFGGPGERESVRVLLEAIPTGRLVDLVGTCDLAAAAACLGRADLFVGNDSGLMHMAAAAGVPTLGLFGPSSEIFYGPCGPRTASVRGARSFEDICHAPDFDHRDTDCMMLDLDTAKVLDAVAALMTKGRTP
ncbi:glycosyl transferase [Magnetospirillum sp. ME-1]|uniref:glycosyltransferase family 9 protein n=1 Tax=Magnetospirillum sp. ME-1 TaxID=1639348 RepID=UPI000A17D710|nr:glycosyltransferase family 9 protein [Magnetospirillum sp. ME-1]ARJ66583.1 glycosyl transferase [Magnetospirillum sp. ME-1]